MCKAAWRSDRILVLGLLEDGWEEPVSTSLPAYMANAIGTLHQRQIMGNQQQSHFPFAA